MGDRRELEIRAIVASFKSARKSADERMLREARQRASRMLDHVAIRIDAERDEDLAAMLNKARRELSEVPQR